MEGVLPTFYAASGLALHQIVLTLAGFVALYTVLMIIEIKLMLKAIRKGPGDALAAPQPSVSHHATGQA